MMCIFMFSLILSYYYTNMTSNNLIKLIEFDPFRSGVRFGISSGSVRVQFGEISNIIWFGRFGSLWFIALAPQFGIATVFRYVSM